MVSRIKPTAGLSCKMMASILVVKKSRHNGGRGCLLILGKDRIRISLSQFMPKTLFCAFNCSYPAYLSAMNVMEFWTSWKWRVDEWIHVFHLKWMKMNFYDATRTQFIKCIVVRTRTPCLQKTFSLKVALLLWWK